MSGNAGLQLGTELAGTGISLIMGLLAAHDKRVKAAKEENAAVGQAVAALDNDLKTIVDALNKGDITEAVGISALQDVRNWYWTFIGPLQQGGQRGANSSLCNPMTMGGPGDGACYKCNLPNRGANGVPNGNHCAGTFCTAGCCIGGNVIEAAISNAIWAISNHGGTFSVCEVVGNKYGLQSRAKYSLTYTKPAHLNSEAEVTINAATGKITVGAPPSNQDVVIASGVVSTVTRPDTGGDVIQHDAQGNDVNVTGAPYSTLTIVIGAALLLLAIVFVVHGRGA